MNSFVQVFIAFSVVPVVSLVSFRCFGNFGGSGGFVSGGFVSVFRVFTCRDKPIISLPRDKPAISDPTLKKQKKQKTDQSEAFSSYALPNKLVTQRDRNQLVYHLYYSDL